jgi:hypothetical protein
MNITVSQNVLLCILIDRYQRFDGICCPLLRRRKVNPIGDYYAECDVFPAMTFNITVFWD